MRKVLVFFLLLVTTIAGFTLYGLFKPMPEGLSYQGKVHEISYVEFLYDLTYEKEGQVVNEHNIFKRVLEIIEQAEEYLVLDMFLFNSEYDGEKDYPKLTEEMTEALLQKKEEKPDMSVTFITDPINTVYGSYEVDHLEQLKKAGVDVILTNLTPIRDANPLYSGFWRTFLKWFGREGEGWVTNPFNGDGPKVTLRSYFKMFNLKGNHRKVVTSEKEAMITSANPHDASAYNSDIAFVFSGKILQDILISEQAVANMSGGHALPKPQNRLSMSRADKNNKKRESLNIQLLTEGKIRENLLQELRNTDSRETIHLGMFFLSEREVVDELKRAADRGVSIKLILDPNETIFGTENIGIPNRPVAKELLDHHNENIEVRFFHTHDEQYHAKLILINKNKESIVIGGSANFTRRNLNNYNLDTSLKVVGNSSHPFMKDVNAYFSRLWNNQDGIYTVAANQYLDDFPSYKMLLFKLQKKTRLTTF